MFFKFQQTYSIYQIQQLRMKKYAFLLIILVQIAAAQNCFNCRIDSCTSNGCLQCENGFMLSSQGWCGIFTPIEGCRIYDASSTNKCQQCQDGRALIDSRCYLKPQNCEVSDKNRQCLTCRTGFTLFRGKCYTQQIQNCPKGSLPTSGYCQPLRAQNCQRVTGDDKICDACDAGYSLINGRCLRVVSTSPCPNFRCNCANGFIFEQNCYQVRIDKCTINRDSIYCAACERGFVAIDGICLEPVKNDDVNCNVKAPLSDYCTGCNQDYFLNIDAFCYRNFNLTDCPTITGLFYLENGKCLYRDRRCDAIDFRNNSFKCLRCQQGFSMINGMCERNICTRFSSDGICQQVFIGYGISGNNQYIRFPTNCLSVIPGTNRCAQCSSFTRNMSMSAAAGSEPVCAYYDANCVEYNMNGSCIQCVGQALNDGYILKERFCYRKAENCARRDPTDLSKCLQCNSGYHVDQITRTCYANVEGCQIYVSGSDCKQCIVQTYLLYNKKCYPANNDCIEFDANNLCKRCSQGLMPFKNLCVFYHPYCIEYGADRFCSRAASGWALGTGMTEQQKTYYRSFMMRGEQIRNRNQMASLNGLFAGAGAGSYVQGALILNFPYSNLVHTKISNVNMFGQVVSCNPGYTLANQACIQKITPNCEQYTLDEICIRCAPRFTLQGDFTCTEGLQCATPQDVSNDRCLKCANGYILIGVQCFKVETKEVIDRWLMYSSFFRLTLSNGYYIAWPRLANCRDQNNPVVCNQCISPYQNVRGQCVMSVAGCTNYGLVQGPSPGICLSCETGSTLWFGQCRRLACTQNVNGICSSCPANHYYYFGYCLPNAVPGCKIYDNGACQLCGYGFYANLQGQCLAEVRGCLTTNRDTGRCLQCRSGLTLYRQNCVLQIMYCLDYDSNNRCTRCQSNTVNRTQLLGDGTCALVQGQCAKVDQRTRQCSQCNLGYSLIRQNNRALCVSIRANCQTYDVRGRCTVCNPKFVLINNQCRIYLQYCLSFSPDQTTCLSCAAGTVLDGGCCKLPDPFCISYTSCLCTGCMSGYFLNDTGLCQANPTGCQIFEKGTNRCLKCAANYYIFNNTCVYRDYIINGCQEGYNLTYNQSNGYQCVKCIQGFELNPADNLCYGYNCAVRFQTTRHCVSCPPYYQIYRGNNFDDYQNYCIPYFCQTYLPGQDVCLKNVTTYYGGHTIVTNTRTIIIIYCASVDPVSYKCTACTNYRYANPNTLYGLCYPLHCVSPLQFNCEKCQFGYGLDARFPGSCIATFCNQWKTDGSCLSCIPPYTLSSSGICENKGCCEQYDSQQNVCRTAKKYYTIQNGICVASMCLSLDPTKLSTCLQCARGFTLFPDGTCRVTNCQQDFFSGDSCIVCNRGFRTELSTTTAKAICVPRYCLQIAVDGNSCLKCAEGFTLDVDKMCRADFCANFQASLVCQTCMPFYVLNANERCVADCSIGSALRCQCCKYGASLNITSGLCQPTQTYCAQNNPSTSMCGTCVSGYSLVSGQCVAPVANCKTPSLFGCLSCNSGYEVVDNCRCVPKFCIQQKPDGSCAQCHPRFELTADGLCKTRDCQYWVAQSWVCNGCYSRFTFSNGMCVTNDCAFWEDYQNTTCKVCKTNTYISSTNFSQMVSAQYELVYGACYIRYCKNDPRDFYCKQCKPGYKLTMNGLCQCISFDASKNQCICPEGYFFNAAKGQCEFNRDVCLSRDQSTGRCLQCPYRYQLPADNQGECVPLYCEKWEVVAPRYIECRKCYNNFVLKDGFCQSSLCTKFQNKTGLLFPQCTACVAGWAPFSNFCVPSKCEASTYNLITGICVKCTSFGYILSVDKTRCIVANCQIELPPDQCSKCKVGYYNFTGLCLANNCSIFAQVTCNGCIDGFYLSNNLCYANNCDKYNDQNFCVQCSAGFQLAKNLTCIRQNCQSDSRDKCLKCARGFIWENNLRRCVPSNCQKYFPNYQECEVCKQGYLKQNSTCLDIRCDINAFTYEYICQRCAAGYEFNSQGLCYPINAGFCPPGKYYSAGQGGCVDIPTPDCRIFVDGKCMWCADGFFLWNSLCYSTRFCSKFSYFFGCYQCIAGYYLDNRQCKVYDSDPNCIQSRNNQCYTCKSGYQLLQGKCILIPQNCQQVDINGRCVRCVPGYTINSNGMCQITDVNCLAVDAQGRCTRCRDNYFINSQGACQSNPTNCANVDSSGRCIICLPGYSLQNGRCFRSYSYCLRYSQSTQFCVECVQNFTLSGIECVCGSDSQLVLNQACIKLPDNCLQIAPSTYLCVRCARNYILTADYKCVKNTTVTPPENCNIYDPATGICRQCFPNYILVNNLCQMCPSGQIKVGNSCYIIIIGCSQYLPSGLCSVCQSGYRLQNGKCTTINPPNFCQVYDPQTGICQKCILGYSITSNGLQCVLNNCLTPSSDGRTCIKCIDTFTWSGRECRLQSQFCISSFNGRCQNCESFTYLNQSRCVPNNCKIYDYLAGVCTSCITNYQLAYRRCFLIIVGCNTYLQSGLCSVCAPGYNLVNGYCQKTVIDIPRFCDQFNQTIGICVRCAAGYSPTIDGKLCILTNCQLMDPSGLLCSRCVSPFQWNGQYCVFITDFCQAYSGGYCSSCLSFTSLQRNRCVPNFCSVYNYTNGICESCQLGYALSLKRCFIVIQYCVSYLQSGMCAMCQSGYSIANGGALCQASSIPSCYSQFSSSVCNRCQHRYYVDSQMCTAYLPYCINIDPLGKCISCCFGSTLINGTCVKDRTIRYCQNQVGNTCQQCLPNYSYCSFCDACLPVSPNCNKYDNYGRCLECFENFVLLNSVCVSMPVGFVSGAAGTCRSGYYLSGGSCFRNQNELRLYSSIRKTTSSNSPFSQLSSSPTSTSTTSISTTSSYTTDAYVVKTEGDPLIIFGILVNTLVGNLSNNASFILYYRSKTNDPMICWNSCIPTKIDTKNFTKNLVHPIIATDVSVYLINQLQQNVGIDFKIL